MNLRGYRSNFIQRYCKIDLIVRRSEDSMKKLKSSEYVKKWRHNFRRRIVEAFGGECGICGYSRCQEALELHHLDPQVKELSFNRIIARACNWVKVVAELRKCVLLCSICHREYHFRHRHAVYHCLLHH